MLRRSRRQTCRWLLLLLLLLQLLLLLLRVREALLLLHPCFDCLRWGCAATTGIPWNGPSPNSSTRCSELLGLLCLGKRVVLCMLLLLELQGRGLAMRHFGVTGQDATNHGLVGDRQACHADLLQEWRERRHHGFIQTWHHPDGTWRRRPLGSCFRHTPAQLIDGLRHLLLRSANNLQLCAAVPQSHGQRIVGLAHTEDDPDALQHRAARPWYLHEGREFRAVFSIHSNERPGSVLMGIRQRLSGGAVRKRMQE
mmetsp:Transcript_43498/g.137554  ORF Transcript_43498/g.137554 Transcript_43498/m.137554 type:complete len:254 (-) Transcript_43498:568-1329(-)